MAQKKAASSKTKTAAPKKKPIRREVWALICLALGLFTAIGYFVKDYWLIDGLCLYVFKGLFGWGFLIVPPIFFWAAIILGFHKGRPVTGRLVALSLMPLVFGAILHLIVCKEETGLDWESVVRLYRGGMNMEMAGVISGVLATVLKQAVSKFGALTVLFIGLLVCVFVGCRISVRDKLEDFRNRAEYEPEPEPQRTAPKARVRTNEERSEPRLFEETAPLHGETESPRRQRRKKSIDIPMDEAPQTEPEPLPEEPIPDMPVGRIYRGRAAKPERPVRPAVEEQEPRQSVPFVPAADLSKEEPVPVEPEQPVDTEPAPEEIFTEPMPEVPFVKSVVREQFPPVEEFSVSDGVEEDKPAGRSGKKVTASEAESAADEIGEYIEDAAPPEEYTYPPVELLRASSGITADGREEVELNRERLESTLHSFGIGASVCDITRGPTVTRYDLELEAGVKLTKITNLAGDLALALGVSNVRIAPIPDKISTVGVEVPNKIVSTVFLRDIIDSSNFRNASSKLSFAIGKDIGGNCIVGNISKLPHMLIAGTTGSGKSVCMNSLILSLLYKATPDEVRLIMIDPKMVELGIYNGIPHLYIPVVTDPKKAAGSLQWAVVEMMKRYRRFSEVGVRNLQGYNDYLTRNGEPPMPNVVVVIDELADLMMTAAKEVEESICRVAQMGRAAGMHLIIATQRPSADVITGLMKANIPSRIAFAVSSSLESRIILDQQGAEKLIGMGDMLYAPLGCGKPLRVQGAFVSDEEREEVIEFIKQGSTAQYDPSILDHIDQFAEKDKEKEKDKGGSNEREESVYDADNPFADCDELLPQAVEVLLDTKQASVSMLQRRLKLGYSRAARLVDQMEELGIVGPFEGSKPRQILITREQWQEMSMSGQTPLERLIEDQKDDYSGEGNE